MSAQRLVLYGDFTCPWSYLAFRRSRLLAGHGFEVDWRAVEHDPVLPGRPRLGRFEELRAAIEQVLPQLLPGERWPYSLAGYVAHTRAAVSGYAEAYAAGVADRAGGVLFDAFWLNAVDLGDPRVVRTLLVDTIRSGQSDSEALRDWGYAVAVTGAPITTAADGLVRCWRQEWSGAGEQVVPRLLTGGRTFVGADAVAWLGDQLLLLGVDLESEPAPALPRQLPRGGLPHYSWASTAGGRWARSSQASFRHAG